MIVTALPPTSQLIKELVGLARTSWEPSELARYLTTRGRLAEDAPGSWDGPVISFSAAGDGFCLYGTEWVDDAEPVELTVDPSELHQWGLSVPVGWLLEDDEDDPGPITDLAEQPGWTKISGDLVGYDAVWKQACETVATELGPPQVTIADSPRNKMAAWQVDHAVLMVAQTTTDYVLATHLNMCAIRLLRLDPGTGLPAPETLHDWGQFCRPPEPPTVG